MRSKVMSSKVRRLLRWFSDSRGKSPVEHAEMLRRWPRMGREERQGVLAGIRELRRVAA